ncbi:MAG: hypothetical protein AB7T49_06105 [Oligoflexales bacterium]
MNKWLVRIVILAALGLFLFKGGGAALGPLMRLAVPIAAIYLIYRGLRSIFRPTLEQTYTSSRNQSNRAPNTIEICPKCGNQKDARHKC